jgi:hypothetical protein
VRLVGKARASGDPARDLAAIDVESEALTARQVTLEGGPAGDATLVEDRPGRLRIEAQAPRRQLLIVSEAHDPGWQARVDGQVAPAERVNGDFLGCVVGPGRHTVEFTFAPPALRWGRLLSGSATALALLLLAVARREACPRRGAA